MKRPYPIPDCARRRTVIAAALLAAAIVFPPGAGAQAPEHALTVSQGIGTVYARPANVTFRIHAIGQGDTVEAAIAVAQAFEKAMRDALAESELRPADIEITAPALLSTEEPAVQSAIALQFSMAPYAGAEAGAAKFAGLCDQVKALAAGAGGQLLGPVFAVADESAVIQEAVRESARNAFIGASGAAAAIGAAVNAVDVLEVESITWNAPPDAIVQYPTLDTITCTVKTRITYLLGYP